MRRALGVLLALLMLPLTTFFAVQPAAAATPPTPTFGPVIDAYAQSETEATCSPTEKPGDASLRDLIVATWGGSSNIVRPCTSAASGHEEGRAIDWMMDTTNPAQEAKAQAFLAWLFATDSYGNPHAMARRLGVMYIEHGDLMYRSYRKDGASEFTALPQMVTVNGVKTACAALPASYATTCHRNHVHISLSWDGAMKRTTYWNPTASQGVPTPVDPTPAPSPTPVPQGLSYVSLEAPARVLDTRSGVGAPAGRVAGGQVLNLPVAGHGGIPATGVGAVVLNVTAVRPTKATYLTVWPAGQARPATSSVNVAAREVRAAMVVAALGPDGAVSLANNSGRTDVVVDVIGYHPTASVPLAAGEATSGLSYHPVTPARLADTRASRSRVLGARRALKVQVAGRAGIPASGAVSVVVNVTVDRPAGDGYVTVTPVAPVGTPATSTLNYRGDAQVANRAYAGLAADGSLSLWVSSAAPVIVDVVGWFGAAADGEQNEFVPVAPVRIAETRGDKGRVGGLHTFGSRTAQRLDVVGLGDVPAGTTAVLATLTATRATTRTYVTAWPGGVAQPVASDVNLSYGDTVSNLVVVPVGADGTIRLYNRAGSLDLVLDLLGYYR